MPPKVKVTKEEIINAAFDITRKSGADAINARTVAAELNCSTQPIFSNFSTMDALRFAVVDKTQSIFEEYAKAIMESGEFPTYKASGMAYIRFAREERELFKLLYMRDRADEGFAFDTEFDREMTDIVSENIGVSGEIAKLFHLEMWSFVHGIATMFATGFLDLDMELVSKMITDCYQGLRKQYKMR